MTGAGIGSMLAGRKKRQGLQQTTIPTYTPSQYDKPAAGQLYDTLSKRARGEGVGYSDEDLNTMKAQAIDESARLTNDTVSRATAGRQMTGGITAGGTNRLRERALIAGGQARSQAMRDVALNNAVLKQQQQGTAIEGLQGFLNSERSNALGIYGEQLYGNAMEQNQNAATMEANNENADDANAATQQKFATGMNIGTFLKNRGYFS